MNTYISCFQHYRLFVYLWRNRTFKNNNQMHHVSATSYFGRDKKPKNKVDKAYIQCQISPDMELLKDRTNSALTLDCTMKNK